MSFIENNHNQISFNDSTFDRIFEKAPIGIAISYSCDLQHTEDTITKINSEYEKITGRTKEELIDLGWANITHPDDLEEGLDKFRELQSGKTRNYSLEN